MNITDLLKNCWDQTKHLSALTGAEFFAVDSGLRGLICYDDSFCNHCGHTGCDKALTHLYGANEAYRWNGKYIYYCPLGLVFVASSISDSTGSLAGSMVVGPVIMGEPGDTIGEIEDERLADRVKALPSISTENVTHLSELLAVLTAHCSGLPHGKTGNFIYEQEKILNFVYDIKDRHLDNHTYPIEYEKKLHELVRQKDKNGAQGLLNELLGRIYFCSAYDFETIKARVLELVVVLSRATIDAGADANEIFLLGENYIRVIQSFADIEELNIWLTGIMYRFIDCSFNFKDAKHSDLVYKVMEYVKLNYQKKISLEDIAKTVYLSRSYLSSMFKEQTGQSLFSYINQVRVEKSKQLLLDESISLIDVAAYCGFEDQSYFTKVFKKQVGLSPKRFRNQTDEES